MMPNVIQGSLFSHPVSPLTLILEASRFYWKPLGWEVPVMPSFRCPIHFYILTLDRHVNDRMPANEGGKCIRGPANLWRNLALNLLFEWRSPQLKASFKNSRKYIKVIHTFILNWKILLNALTFSLAETLSVKRVRGWKLRVVLHSGGKKCRQKMH